MPFRLIVGLGNPGAEHRQTRHNVGFMLLDRLAASAGVSFRTEKAWRAEVARTADLFLCKPLSFMNLSGEVVRAVCDFYKIAPADILIVLDDMALPLGKMRLRSGGSSGGHNGLQSVIDHLGSAEVPRLRIGIGGPPPGGAIGHVLGRFAVDEEQALTQTLDRAAEAITCAHERGLAAAMNSFN